MIAAALRIALAWLIVCAVVVASVWAATRRALRPADVPAIQDADDQVIALITDDPLEQAWLLPAYSPRTTKDTR
jgi:hypothetical protein